jgi:hypothetical protein
MRCLGKVGPFAAAVVVLLGAGVEAGSVPIRHDPAQIEAAAIKLYEREVVLRDMDPKAFDRVHRLGGRMLSNESVYERLLREWEEHPARFERDHRCLWHVLRGEMYFHELHPFVPPLDPPRDWPGPRENAPQQPGGGDPGNHHDGGPGGGIGSASVPEPSSAALLASALAVVLLAATCRRAYERLRPAPPAGS